MVFFLQKIKSSKRIDRVNRFFIAHTTLKEFSIFNSHESLIIIMIIYLLYIHLISNYNNAIVVLFGFLFFRGCC